MFVTGVGCKPIKHDGFVYGVRGRFTSFSATCKRNASFDLTPTCVRRHPYNRQAYKVLRLPRKLRQVSTLMHDCALGGLQTGRELSSLNANASCTHGHTYTHTQAMIILPGARAFTMADMQMSTEQGADPEAASSVKRQRTQRHLSGFVQSGCWIFWLEQESEGPAV